MSSSLNKLVGEKLLIVRKEKNLTQQELADKIGVSRASIVNTEKGNQTLTLPNLYRIVIELDITIADLLPSPVLLMKGSKKAFDVLIEQGIDPSEVKKFILSQKLGIQQ